MKLELFSCSGGMAEGFRRAGIVFDMVFDYDTDACNSYAANHGHRPIQMDVRDLVRMVRAGWRPGGGVDLLVADPPCTPWSRAGKRLGTADERDMLEETAELIQFLRPRTYLIGNVPGLQDSNSWGVVQRVIGGLSAFGYCVADYVSLDAADYGVPQHRVRPLWFGHLDGPCVRWPAPTHGPARESLPGLGLLPWLTCREALQHLALEELGRPVRMKIRPPKNAGGTNGGERAAGGQILIPTDKHPPAYLDGLAPTIRGGGNGHSAPPVVLVNDRHPPASPSAPAPTIGAKDRGQSTVLRAENPNLPPQPLDAPSRSITTQAGDTHLLGIGPEDGRGTEIRHPASATDEPSMTIKENSGRTGSGAALQWPWDRPSTTIQRDERIAPPGHHDEKWDGGLMSDPNAVVLSEKAAAILQGFPEGWVFSGDTKKARWAQIGMAMPPALAEAVARAIVEQMQARGTTTKSQTDLESLAGDSL